MSIELQDDSNGVTHPRFWLDQDGDLNMESDTGRIHILTKDGGCWVRSEGICFDPQRHTGLHGRTITITFPED